MVMLRDILDNKTHGDLREKTFNISQKEIRARFEYEAIMTWEKRLSHRHQVIYSAVNVGNPLSDRLPAR